MEFAQFAQLDIIYKKEIAPLVVLTVRFAQDLQNVISAKVDLIGMALYVRVAE
jgi:hypothetical protein